MTNKTKAMVARSLDILTAVIVGAAVIAMAVIVVVASVG